MEPRIRAAADITGLGVLRLIDGPDDSMFVEGWDPSERTWSRKSVDGRTVESIVLGALSPGKVDALGIPRGDVGMSSEEIPDPVSTHYGRISPDALQDLVSNRSKSWELFHEVKNWLSERGYVCLQVGPWVELHKFLTDHPKRELLPSSIPGPLILSGWSYSSDEEKRERFVLHLELCCEIGILPEVFEHLKKCSKSDWWLISI